VIDFGIRISQAVVGDDAIGKLAKLEQQIGRETSTIARMEDKLVSAKKKLDALMEGAGGGKGVNIAAVDRMRESISKLEGDLAKKRGGLAGLTSGLGGAQEAAGLEQSLAAVKNMAATAGPMLALAAAVMAVVFAVGAAVVALSHFALMAADAHRTTLLLMGALSGSASAGAENVAAIERVADSTALAKGQIEAIGKRLAVAGLEGARFEATLGAVSLAASLLGESAGQHLESIIERSKALGHFQFSDRQLKGLGLSFADLASQLGMTGPAFKAAMKAGRVSVEQGVDAMNAAIAKRFGGGGAALMLGFDVQMMKLREHLAALFKDINIEPFLVAMHDLLSVFDKSGGSGEAMHFMLTKGFDALFATLARIEPFAKAFFQGLVIGALVVYIAIVKVKRAIEEAFGGASLGGIDGITVAMYAGILVFGLMLGAAVALTAVLVVLAGAMLFPFIPVIALLALLYIGFKIGEGAVNAFADAIGGVKFPDFGDPGKAMVDGLVNSITGGADRFAAAMRGLGQSGMGALNSIFHFGSPSRAMEQRGEWIDEGGARGVEQGGAMRRAMGGMARPDDARGDGDGKRVAGGPVYITIDARGTDKSTVDYMLEKLGDVFEGAAIIVGAAPDPEPT